MDQELQNAEKRVVGTKQVLRALNGSNAARVFLAKDADGFIYHRINSLCEETKTPVTMVDTMQELGKLCAVGVKTAAAAAAAPAVRINSRLEKRLVQRLTSPPLLSKDSPCRRRSEYIAARRPPASSGWR